MKLAGAVAGGDSWTRGATAGDGRVQASSSHSMMDLDGQDQTEELAVVNFLHSSTLGALSQLYFSIFKPTLPDKKRIRDR